MVRENLIKVQQKIDEACERSGRDPKEVTLIAVSKTKPIEMIEEAIDAGKTQFGENKAQEMKEKYEALPKNLEWHFIGHLQTNKVKYVVGRADNIKLYTMVAEAQGMEQFMGTNTNKIKVSLTGLLSAFWSCSYYFNPETLSFVGYKGVNGKPGTPETIIKIIK